jgi:hypothetical protein
MAKNDGSRRAGKGAAAKSTSSSNITTLEITRQTRTAQDVRLDGGYDKQFEAELTDAIGTLITTASTLPGSDVLYIRSLETLRALSTAMAAYLAMIPDAVGSGIELRATIDDLADGLFKLATATASSPHTQQFRKRLRYLRDGEATR